MDIEKLPLLELFSRLRKAGLSLGIGEYQLLIQALRGGFGLSDRAALSRLCCTLWVKSPQEKGIFDYHFEQLIGKPNSLPVTSTSSLSIAEDLLQPETNSEQCQTNQTARNLALGGILLLSTLIIVSSDSIVLENQPSPESLPETPPENSPENPPETPTETPLLNAIPNLIETTWPPLFWGGLLGILLTLLVGVIAWRWRSKRIAKGHSSQEGQLGQVTQTQTNASLAVPLTEEIDEIKILQLLQGEQFLMKHDCFPITHRQLKQSWRYLRRLVRSGKPTELDIQATVKQISRQGFLLNPVFVPRRLNRTQLLLLLDHDGSMVPFHGLAHRLAETSLQAGRLGKASIYYFHNCPLEYLYQDLHHQEAELISHILPRLEPKWTVALIFSDAGALRGGLSPERIKLTAGFLDRLRQQVRYLVWLNPMPSERWQGTSAGEIARLVPMFALSRQGFQQAIDVLRGAAKK